MPPSSISVGHRTQHGNEQKKHTTTFKKHKKYKTEA